MKALMRWTTALLAVGLLGGCAALNNVRSEVSTFGEWPAARKPGAYAFERLPSQQSQADQQAQLEALARPALAAAGFQPVADGQTPEFLASLPPPQTCREGIAWTARLLADGKPVGTVTDAGQGGMLRWDVADVELYAAAEAYAMSLPPVPLSELEKELGYDPLPMDLDSAVCILADGGSL